ncbi:MAG TPA: hypothetical protein VGG48_08065 [Rhizomicrobium sp.]|jgi:hypothetical protein
MRYVIGALFLLCASRAAADDQACDAARHTLEIDNATTRELHELGKGLNDQSKNICDTRLRATLASDVESLQRQLEDIKQIDSVCADKPNLLHSADSMVPSLSALLAKGQQAITSVTSACGGGD